MESTVRDRLKLFIKSEGMTHQKFEKTIGLSNGYVSNISKGIGGDVLLRILNRFPHLNRDWLVYGEGEMRRTSGSETSSKTKEDVYLTLLKEMNEKLDNMKEELLKREEQYLEIIKSLSQK